MTVTKKSLSVLVLCTFCTLLAALEVGGMGGCVWCDARWMLKQGVASFAVLRGIWSLCT